MEDDFQSGMQGKSSLSGSASFSISRSLGNMTVAILLLFYASAGCLAHSRCSKLAINFLLRTIYFLVFSILIQSETEPFQLPFPVCLEPIHLLDLPARPLINIYLCALSLTGDPSQCMQ